MHMHMEDLQPEIEGDKAEVEFLDLQVQMVQSEIVAEQEKIVNVRGEVRDLADRSSQALRHGVQVYDKLRRVQQ